MCSMLCLLMLLSQEVPMRAHERGHLEFQTFGVSGLLMLESHASTTDSHPVFFLGMQQWTTISFA